MIPISGEKIPGCGEKRPDFILLPQRYQQKAVHPPMKASLNGLKLAAAIGAATSALLVAAPAVAQENGGYTITAGIGGQVLPKYPGAASYSLYPMPIFGLRREGAPMPYVAQDQGIGFGVLGQGSSFNFGPCAGGSGQAPASRCRGGGGQCRVHDRGRRLRRGLSGPQFPAARRCPAGDRRPSSA